MAAHLRPRAILHDSLERGHGWMPDSCRHFRIPRSTCDLKALDVSEDALRAGVGDAGDVPRQALRLGARPDRAQQLRDGTDQEKDPADPASVPGPTCRLNPKEGSRLGLAVALVAVLVLLAGLLVAAAWSPE